MRISKLYIAGEVCVTSLRFVRELSSTGIYTLPMMSTETESRPRIHGLDLARALAIAGMMTTHLTSQVLFITPLVHGYASGLFAILSGVSVAIMTQRGNQRGGLELTRARHRLLIRGVLILALGVALSALPTTILVVLGAISAIILLLGPCTRWPSSLLILLLIFILIPGVAAVSYLDAAGNDTDVLSYPYPLLAWISYGLWGILIYRHLVPARAGIKLLVAIIGLALGGAAGFLRYSVVDPPSIDSSKEFMAPDATTDFLVIFLSADAHTGGLGDITATIIWGSGVIALCLLLCCTEVLTKILYPLRAMGSMALSVYILHVLTAGFFMVGGIFDAASINSVKEMEYHNSYVGLGISLVGALLFASLWRVRYGRGPAEEGLRAAERALLREDLPPLTAPSPLTK